MNYQQRIMSRVDALVAQQPKLKPLSDLFHEYLTTDNIGGMELGSRVFDILRAAGVERGSPLYKETFGISQEADLYSSENLRSPQEFALIQSARGEEGISPTTEPYRIMALDKGVSLEDIQEARNRIGLSAHGSYFGLDTDLVGISVEPVDSEGRTIRDPLPLREDGKPMTTSEYNYAGNFPFRRK